MQSAINHHFCVYDGTVEFTLHHRANCFNPLVMVVEIQEHGILNGKDIVQTLGYVDHMFLSKLRDAIDAHLNTHEEWRKKLNPYAVLQS